jgi:hypothetical protein
MSIHQFMYGCDAILVSVYRYVRWITYRHTEHVSLPISRRPEHEDCCKPTCDRTEDHAPHHDTLFIVSGQLGLSPLSGANSLGRL